MRPYQIGWVGGWVSGGGGCGSFFSYSQVGLLNCLCNVRVPSRRLVTYYNVKIAKWESLEHPNDVYFCYKWSIVFILDAIDCTIVFFIFYILMWILYNDLWIVGWMKNLVQIKCEIVLSIQKCKCFSDLESLHNLHLITSPINKR